MDAIIPWFRAPSSSILPCPLPVGALLGDRIRNLIENVIGPGNFFVSPDLALVWDHVAQEEIPWEIYRGRLLDRSQTRLHGSSESWNVFQEEKGVRSAEPMLSVKFDPCTGQIHVVRGIHCYAWEGYHAGDNVYLSREKPKWIRELVGTITLDQFRSYEEVHDELICQIFQAVVGTSRLPLSSIESPLPAFSLGQLGYIAGPPVNNGKESLPVRSFSDLIATLWHRELSWREKARLLETMLRSLQPDEVDQATSLFISRWQQLGYTQEKLQTLLRTLFNETALSPYTGFVDRALAFVEQLVARSYFAMANQVDFLSYLLRSLGRHLTAYDLDTFHHRGANYPDALLLDAVLKAYLRLAASRLELFLTGQEDTTAEQDRKRLRRRALRQGWLLRRWYEGLRVPEIPTSPGENARILPPPYVRVPEEQIIDPGRRPRRLFADDPLVPLLGNPGLDLLRQSIQDLHHPLEMRELGLAIFLDRPLGKFKAPGEPDRTPLFSYEAFSKSIAERRLKFLAREEVLGMAPGDWDHFQELLKILQIDGVSLVPGTGKSRPETVSLKDAFMAAPDFIFMRTTRQTLADFLGRVPKFTSEVPWKEVRLILSATALGDRAEDLLVIFDSRFRRCWELRIQPQHGIASRAGMEFPAVDLIGVPVEQTTL